MLKNFFAVLIFIMTILAGVTQVEAADEWVYTYPSGIRVYIVRESVVYGYRSGFYAKVRVKSANSSGELIRSVMLEFNRDEGDRWYGIEGERGGRRVYDDEDATEILRWLQAHQSEARRTANPSIRVLGD